jgi:hypothetical protein
MEDASKQEDASKRDPVARIETDEIVLWAERLNVTPEELRSAVQKAGDEMQAVLAELERRRAERP